MSSIADKERHRNKKTQCRAVPWMATWVAVAILTLAGLSSSVCGASPSKRPNIVFLMADDMGYGDLGCYNDRSKIPTPNMDQLAAQGMRFTDAHTPSSVCTPTRYGVLTGRYCWRSRMKSRVLWGFDRPLIVRWPSKIAANIVSKELVCLTDLLATAANILGETLPETAGQDSVSILPVLQGKNQKSPLHEAIVLHDYLGRFAIRSANWKYVAPSEPPNKPRNSARRTSQSAELYNLDSDPQEATNVLGQHPEVADRLAAFLEKYKAQGHSRSG